MTSVQVGQRWRVDISFTSHVTGVLFLRKEEFEIMHITTAGQYILTRVKDCTSSLESTISADEITQNCTLLVAPSFYGPGMGTSVPVLPIGISGNWIHNDVGLTADAGASLPIIYGSPETKKCECGSSAIGINKHSSWCQLYSKDQ